jgi:hypothetical protein
LSDPTGVDFDACYSRRVYRELDGVAIPFISLDDLRRNKKASGRLKDLADLDGLPSKSTAQKTTRRKKT